MIFNVQSYFDTLLRYVLSVTICGAAVLKVMDQKTLVRRGLSCKVRSYTFVVLSKIIPNSRPKWANFIPIFRQNDAKTAPFWAAHTYMACVREFPSGILSRVLQLY